MRRVERLSGTAFAPSAMARISSALVTQTQ
jgi:hypothetical protein